LLHAASSSAATPHFSDFTAPKGIGERQLSVLVDYKGVPPKEMRVFLVYADKPETVGNSFDTARRTGRESSANATCEAAESGLYRCRAILPHEQQSKPNARDDNPKSFADGALVHYAWAKEFRVSSTVQPLVLNSPTRSVSVPRRITLGLLGDSYAAGQGAPNRPLTRTVLNGNGAADSGAGMWNDTACHRSKYSGFALAVDEIVKEHPELAFDSKNLTCSGATIEKGLTERQGIARDPLMDVGGRRPVATRPAQVNALFEWLSERKHRVLDVLVMSIGGNDVGFGNIGSACLLDVLGECAPDIKSDFKKALGKLPKAYRNLNSALRAEAKKRNMAIGRTYITEYPDPTHGGAGRICGGLRNGTDPFDCWGVLESAISIDDFTHLYERVLLPLNQQIKASAKELGWTYLAGSMEVSNEHGLCNCSAGWFVTPGQSDYVQGDLLGSIHPNRTGYRKIYKPIVKDAIEGFLRARPAPGLDLELLAGFERSDAITVPIESMPPSLTLSPGAKAKAVKAVPVTEDKP
jgi:hypothetical protein